MSFAKGISRGYTPYLVDPSSAFRGACCKGGSEIEKNVARTEVLLKQHDAEDYRTETETI